ncbi:GNAT-family acetyltransferase TIGR03103 [Geodermatophilus telluris]|uniref:GNAT-family acetyltransferase TIGR03103 n=1 Tax=Geodermatophilus telluris TaxID=1190417 RepID=A0A1G6R1F9_9ACTN|nr:GNAT family N-acetyltransferase [Geodermatophilus telluris]SDC98398.1 GNAT-family acetyltransferase TIGR03103 [Geodermatophilus telluris]
MVARSESRRRPLAAVPTITGTPRQPPSQHQLRGMDTDAVLDLGWGRLVFGQTFADPRRLVGTLRDEADGRRDICVYPRDPQVLVGLAPADLFLDPSLTFRLDLHRYRPRRELIPDVFVRTVTCPDDVAEVERIVRLAGMVPGDPATVWHNHSTRTVRYLVAEDRRSGRVVGTVTGVDHVRAFGDPEGGSSLWCLAAHPEEAPPGTGEALVRVLAERYLARGRSYLDLSVLHDNAPAIALYRKLGFRPVPALVVKCRNAVNAPLFTPAPPGLDRLGAGARLLADEALRRGVRVEVTDADRGEVRFTLGARSVLTCGSLPELTSAVALGRCEDQRVARRVAAGAGVRVLDGAPPPGEDVRVVVIDAEVVAAGVRRPAAVVGDGVSDLTTLVRRAARRRDRTTGGRSRLPLDDETAAAVARAGWAMDDVPPAGERIAVRPGTDDGGTVEDVTGRLHPEIAAAAVRAAAALGLPVAGLDLRVPDVEQPGHVLVGADPRPDLADHRLRPVAARFLDLLLPETRRR